MSNKVEHNLIKTMRNTIATHNMFKDGDRVVVGVSGGADSVALLRALRAVQSDFNLTVVVCHINHKIRPGSAERDQEFVRALCDELNIEFHTKDVEVETLAAELGLSTEEAGRRVRYEFFNEIAGENGKIATAHNRNDNAETVMMRFMRGTGLHGLTGIPYKRDNIVRPILDVARSEIEDYLSSIGQDHITDESNLEAIYTRNKIRLNLIPEIEKEFNPNFINTLTNNIKNYAEEDDFIKKSTDEIIDKYFRSDADNVRVSCDMIKNVHIAIAKRSVISEVKRVFGIDLSSQSVQAIIESFDKCHGYKMNITKDIVVKVENRFVIVYNTTNDTKVEKDEREIFVATQDDDLMDLGWVKVKMSNVYEENVENNAHVYYMPANKLNTNTLIRTRRDGDIVAVAPGMSKKLKKFFIDRKTPARYRDKYWLLIQDNKVVWIPGLFGGRLKDEERSGEFYKFEVVY